MKTSLLLTLFLSLLLSGCEPPPEAVLTTHGRFKEVKVYHTDGNDDPLVMLVYDASSETRLAERFVAQLQDRRTDVLIVSTEQIRKDFPNDVAKCLNISGDFENMARYLEAYLHYQGFIPPVVVTTPGSKALAASVLPKLSSKAFLGRFDLADGQATQAVAAVDPQACTPRPATDNIEPAPSLTVGINSFFTWQKVDTDALASAFEQLYQRLPPEQKLDDEIADLPLTELPSETPNDSVAILISGDGGWAGFDKTLAEAMQAKGISVVGWDSLRYFWEERTPESVASDLNKVISYYLQHWSKKKLYLLGFSQGADVLPFVLPLLEPAGKNVLAKVALISPEHFAQFEFHLGAWVHDANSGLELLPALRALKGFKVLCLYGSGDKTTVCPELTDTQIKVHGFKGGHHPTVDIPEMVSMLIE